LKKEEIEKGREEGRKKTSEREYEERERVIQEER